MSSRATGARSAPPEAPPAERLGWLEARRTAKAGVRRSAEAAQAPPAGSERRSAGGSYGPEERHRAGRRRSAEALAELALTDNGSWVAPASTSRTRSDPIAGSAALTAEHAGIREPKPQG